MAKTQYKDVLKDLAFDLGASAFGACELGDLVEKIHPEIRETARALPYAISIAIALQKVVLDTIIDRPNEIYKSHYRATNTQLDMITYRLSQKIESWGKKALPIPASMVIRRYPMIGHINHREVAYKAGLGWRGKNNLLVSKEWGTRLRLATVLTDCELEPDDILGIDCGACHACGKRCPANAIGESPDDFDLDKCRERVTAFSRENNFGHLICGLCLNCCPIKTGNQ